MNSSMKMKYHCFRFRNYSLAIFPMLTLGMTLLTALHATGRRLGLIPSLASAKLSTQTIMASSTNTAYLALGSNIGERATNIHSAIQELKKLGDVTATSFLYQSEPMYYLDQPQFLNCACLLTTQLNAHQLLHAVKNIESLLGREKTFRNGPRTVDVDIIFFNDEIVHDGEQLRIPHPRLQERDFVLRPLHDIHPPIKHPILLKQVASLWTEWQQSQRSQLQRVIPCINRWAGTAKYLTVDTGKPLIMGILNVTPDSFSDGGRFHTLETAIKQAKQLIDDGADILDIGGESTRPMAATVEVNEEVQRVVPVIRKLRESGLNIPISVDTRKADVARQAVMAGADIVNDVSAGTYDPGMFDTVAELGVPYIAMHMRGTPATMLQSQHTTYDDDVVQEVASELVSRLSELDRKVPRWLQIVDPGIGFAKGWKENEELLRPDALRAFKSSLNDRCLLVGASRKRFLTRFWKDELYANPVPSSDITTQTTSSLEPSDLDRDFMTSGVGCLAVLGGADILRVHNVRAAKTVVGTFAHLYKAK